MKFQKIGFENNRVYTLFHKAKEIDSEEPFVRIEIKEERNNEV